MEPDAELLALELVLEPRDERIEADVCVFVFRSLVERGVVVVGAVDAAEAAKGECLVEAEALERLPVEDDAVLLCEWVLHTVLEELDGLLELPDVELEAVEAEEAVAVVD